MPRHPRHRVLIVAAAVVSTVTLGIVVNLMSDGLGEALAAHPYWYLIASASLIVAGVAASYVYEGAIRKPQLDENASSSGDAEAPPTPLAPVGKSHLRVGRRVALGGLTVVGMAAAGLTWRKNVVNLVEHGDWDPGWVSVDRREFSGSFPRFSQNGSKILHASWNPESITVHDIATGVDHRFTWDDDTRTVSMALDGERERVASTHYYNEDTPRFVRIWSLESASLLDELEIATDWEPTLLSFNPIRPELFVAREWRGGERTESLNQLDLWDIDSVATLKSVPLPASPTWMTISPDGSIVAVASEDSRVDLFNTTTLELVFTAALPGAVGSICFDSNSTVLATAGTDGGSALNEKAAMAVWDLESRSQTAFRTVKPELTGTAVAIHPQGREVTLGTTYSWHIDSKGPVLPGFMVWDLTRKAPSHWNEVEGLTFCDLRYSKDGAALEGLLELESGGFAWQRWKRAT